MPKPLRYLSPLHKATRQIGLHFEERMATTGLAPSEGHMLTYLRAYAPCTIAEVLRVFGVRGSTATSMFDRLEQRGLIERVANPADRRSFLLQLTRSGVRLADEIQQWVDDLEKAIRGGITEADDRAFRAVMEAIAAATAVTVVDRPATSLRRKPASPRSRSRTR
jgi:DNA-binding MarR family transcriptional regulator